VSYLFVDQILTNDPGKRVTGTRVVRPDELYLTIGRSGAPALLPAIVGEALGQLGAWSVMQASQFRLRPVAGVVDQVTIYDDVYVGEQLMLVTEIVTWDEQAIDYRSVATVGDRRILTIEHAIGPMLPLTEFNDPQQMQQLFTRLSAADSVASAGQITGQLSSPCTLIAYDNIIEWQPGQQVIAEKHIPADAPYFSEHFPRKPVLPLTMLLSANLSLAQQWLVEWLTPAPTEQLVPYLLRKVKMRDFISPNTMFTTVIRLKSQQDQQFVLQLVNKVAGKPICGLEVIFHYANNSET
jgi:3-hydroxymyristoyl/3-hydroxydecanoyl-(acyl carrier protein) dehydratase